MRYLNLTFVFLDLLGENSGFVRVSWIALRFGTDFWEYPKKTGKKQRPGFPEYYSTCIQYLSPGHSRSFQLFPDSSGFDSSGFGTKTGHAREISDKPGQTRKNVG
jgi:hypothetical protein